MIENKVWRKGHPQRTLYTDKCYAAIVAVSVSGGIERANDDGRMVMMGGPMVIGYLPGHRLR